MYGTYSNIKICGIQSVVPENTVDNEEIVANIETVGAKKFIRYTGVKKRHLLVEGQTASDLAAFGADKLLDKLGWDRNEIRVLVNVTQSPDLEMPSTAVILQKRLGIGTDCIAFDVNHGCAAYAVGLQIVSALLQNTGGKALLFVSEGIYKEMSESPSLNSLLFGDGAAVTAIELSDDHPMYYSQNIDGNRFDLLYRKKNSEMFMDGNGIMNFSLNEVSKGIKDFKDHFKIDEDQIDFYIIHQAQKMIVDGIIDEAELPPEKVLTAYSEYGNTSPATLPITICHNRDAILEKNKETLTLMLSGFGIGLTWSNVLIKLDKDAIHPIIETGHRYLDLP